MPPSAAAGRGMADESSDRLAQALRAIAVLEERVKNRDDALALQAREYERRLNDLNHAHERAQADKLQFLPQSVHDQFYSEYQEWRRGVDKVLTALSARRDANLALFSAVISVLGLIFVAFDSVWRRM
jgi:hypothetical protein